MFKEKDVVIHLTSKLDADYRNNLDELFYFNRNQLRYVDRINKSIEDYSKPVVIEENGEVALVFEKQDLGQTLYILDDDSTAEDAALIGVIMYVRDSVNTITIVHIALHETCKIIYKQDNVNILAIILNRIFEQFSKLKGLEKVRIYYINKEFRLNNLLKESIKN